MKILVIAAAYPMSDRAAGGFRFYEMLKILAARHEVFFCATNLRNQAVEVGEIELQRYGKALEDVSVRLEPSGPIAALKAHAYEAILFEFYQAATRYLDAARFWQAGARIVVDSVDFHFRRFHARAELTGRPEDREYAKKIGAEELRVYRTADLVIAVTDEDRRAMLGCINTPVELIPTIHPVRPLSSKMPENRATMVFVGGFLHEPNIDAMRYFCAEIFPLIKQQVPRATLTIVGNAPPESIKRLAGDSVVVTGFVPDTRQYLASSAISVAPLRYGAGMKGKVGEAIAHGLPVVTTSIGIEGFGLSPGENILVGDGPHEFAAHVVSLIQHGELYDKIRSNGWRFINQNFSEAAVAARLHQLIDGLPSYPLRRLTLAQRVKMNFTHGFQRHIAWRFRSE